MEIKREPFRILTLKKKYIEKKHKKTKKKTDSHLLLLSSVVLNKDLYNYDLSDCNRDCCIGRTHLLSEFFLDFTHSLVLIHMSFIWIISPDVI